MSRHFLIKVCLHIVSQHFGPIAEEVCRYLGGTDQGTLSTILRHFHNIKNQSTERSLVQDVKPHHVRQAVLSLLHHGCVTFSYEQSGAGINSPCNYKINTSAILNRDRFSTLQYIARNKFPVPAEQILLEIFLSGRCTYKHIISALQTQIDSSDSFYVTLEQIKHAFNQLVHHRFIISAPITTPTPAAQSSENSDFVKKKSGSSTTNATTTTTNRAVKSAVMKEPAVAAVKVEPSGGVARNPGRRKQSRATAEETAPADLPVELQLMMAANASSDAGPSGMELQQAVPIEPAQAEQSGGRKRPNPSSNVEKPAKKMRGRSNMLTVTSQSAQVEVGVTERNGDGAFLGSMTGEFSSETQLEQGSDLDAMLKSNVVWTLGWDQLYRECRHQCCVNFAAARNESLAGSIVRTILSASMSLNNDVGYLQTKSASLSAEKIHQKLLEEAADGSDSNSSSSSGGGVRVKMEMGSTPSPVVDIVTLRRLLEIMRLDSTPVLLKVIGSDKTPGGPEYMVNMETVITALKDKTRHKIAVDRFGQASGRIIELLVRNKYLEQQAISDMVLVPAREARERLYRLYRDRWVNYVELSKRCDFSPATSFFFWFLDMDRMQAAIVNHLYQAVYNLKIRRSFEYAKERHLIDFAVTSEYDQTRYDALQTKLKTLDNAIVNLDKTVMLLDKL